MEVSFVQSKRLTSLSAALQDTAPWDPSTCPRPSSFSTPKQRSLDEDVVVRLPRRSFDETQKPVPLSLSNRFASLAVDSPGPPAANTAALFPPDLGSIVDFPALQKEAAEIPVEHGRTAASSDPARAPRITTKASSAPDRHYKLDLPLEKNVNQALLDLHKMASDRTDPHLCDFLESHYLNEQVESIKKLGDHITNLTRMDAHTNKMAEYLFDKHTLGSKS
uniref:ferroxidase n=1 Tax=Oryzias melastigma TaxID=30732 RepID=A0A3B3DE05_ORYME